METPSPRFSLLPSRWGSVSSQMAWDYLLFQWMGRMEKGQGPVRFRHLAWSSPGVTFGYRQKWAEVRRSGESWSEFGPPDYCRRVSGGGIVRHQHDLTWSLLLPARLALTEQPAPMIYQWIHESLREALGETGRELTLFQRKPDPAQVVDSGSCFVAPEPGDLILRQTGEKVAGAAMKRGKQGILWEGTLQLAALPEIDQEALTMQWSVLLAHALGETWEEDSFPDWPMEMEEEAVTHFASPEWNQKR